MPPKLLKGKLVFVGPHAKDGAPRCGVVLSAPDGINNGTVGGHTYFECRDKHGILAMPASVYLLAAENEYASLSMNTKRYPSQ